MNTVWVRHPDTGGVAEVPETAVPMLRQSGWDLMSGKDVAARERQAAAALVDAEKAMQNPATAPVAAPGDDTEKETG